MNHVEQNMPPIYTMVTYKDFNVFVFKKALNVYKMWNERKVDDTFSFNFILFEKIHKLFDIMGYLLIFAAASRPEYFDSVVRDLKIGATERMEDVKLSTFIPKNRDDLLLYFTKYPLLIDELSDVLFGIINLENYEGLVVLNRMERNLYFSVFETAEDDQKLDVFQYDTELFYQKLRPLVKHYLKVMIDISKEKE